MAGRAGDRHESGIVKVFGCRPPPAVLQTPVAGLRKPARDETAGDARSLGVSRAQLWGFNGRACRVDGRSGTSDRVMLGVKPRIMHCADRFGNGKRDVFTLSGNHICRSLMLRSRRISISCMCATRRLRSTWLMRGDGSPARRGSRLSPAGPATPMRSALCSPRAGRNHRWCCSRGTRPHGSSGGAAFRKSAKPRWRLPSPRHPGRRAPRQLSATISARRSASPRPGALARCM